MLRLQDRLELRFGVVLHVVATTLPRMHAHALGERDLDRQVDGVIEQIRLEGDALALGRVGQQL